MTPEKKLHALIESAPAHIQRHFASDCAERALRRAKVKDKRLWGAIEVSRRFAEGKATPDELAAARSAAGVAALAAARAAARDAAGDEEREWQLAHLQYLLAAQKTTRSSLLVMLYEHAARVQVSPSFAQTLEEVLFT